MNVSLDPNRFLWFVTTFLKMVFNDVDATTVTKEQMLHLSETIREA